MGCKGRRHVTYFALSDFTLSDFEFPRIMHNSGFTVQRMHFQSCRFFRATLVRFTDFFASYRSANWTVRAATIMMRS